MVIARHVVNNARKRKIHRKNEQRISICKLWSIRLVRLVFFKGYMMLASRYFLLDGTITGPGWCQLYSRYTWLLVTYCVRWPARAVDGFLPWCTSTAGLVTNDSSFSNITMLVDQLASSFQSDAGASEAVGAADESFQSTVALYQSMLFIFYVFYGAIPVYCTWLEQYLQPYPWARRFVVKIVFNFYIKF